MRQDSVTASYSLYAFMKQNAVGYSPFGIEDLALPPEAIEKPPMEVMEALNIDPSAFDITGSREYLGEVYHLVKQMKPLYLKYRGTGHLQSYVKKADTDFGTWFRFEEYDLGVAYLPKMPAKPLAAGAVYELAANKSLIVGMMSTLAFHPKEGENRKVAYLKLEEGTIEKGEWKLVQHCVINSEFCACYFFQYCVVVNQRCHRIASFLRLVLTKISGVLITVIYAMLYQGIS